MEGEAKDVKEAITVLNEQSKQTLDEIALKLGQAAQIESSKDIKGEE